MGRLEEAAHEILAQRQRDLDGQSEHFQRRDAERNAAIGEFLALAKEKGFPVEITFRQSAERNGNLGFNERDTPGWVVRTETPGEYQMCIARGVLMTVDGNLRNFTAEPVHHIPGHGPRDVSPFYKAYPYGSRSDAFILLSDEEASPYGVDQKSLAECAAWYMTAAGK
ncbi:hypothetical protein [Arthrobacter sp. OY3WO11]|uniref:hypothetical protein n=1 Tax=Arthrobacter sp. OY3WO11 TaxID=1835723 RepID=UPI0007CFC152|nr:hypothetical protein [Arthrobacter sp. OY3WO11]OAE01768.1 hypothetical protein A6A22_10335 [Arthrobacter sp. OY3WO11]